MAIPPLKTKETVIHIPDKGCHNCRLHCVNHKECNSEYPCKQGGEWRPITPEVEKQQKDDEFPILENPPEDNIGFEVEEQKSDLESAEKSKTAEPSDRDIENASIDYESEQPYNEWNDTKLRRCYQQGAKDMRDGKIYVSPKE